MTGGQEPPPRRPGRGLPGSTALRVRCEHCRRRHSHNRPLLGEVVVGHRDDLWWYPQSKLLGNRMPTQPGHGGQFGGTVGLHDDILSYSPDDLIRHRIDPDEDVIVVCGRARYYLAGRVPGRELIGAARAVQHGIGEALIRPTALGRFHFPEEHLEELRPLMAEALRHNTSAQLRAQLTSRLEAHSRSTA